MRTNILHHEHEYNKQRSSLTNEHLEDILKTSTSNITPGYHKLVAENRCNVSH
jgi:hypothetical protein